MRMKKVIAMLLASVSAVTVLASCGGGGEKVANIDEIMAREDVANYVYPEQIELKIPIYDRGTPGAANVADNYWTKYVQKEFGDKHNIKMTYISIPRKEEVTKFNQLLAGKKENQPDVIYNYDYPSIVTFAGQGAFQELDEAMIEKYAPNFYARTKDLDKYASINGERLFLVASRPLTFNYVVMIRKDWLDKIGVTEIPNEEAYIEVLKKFRDEKLGGEGTIPETKSLGSGANYGNYLYRPYPMPEEENALYSDITVASVSYEATKEQLRYDNMKYNEGLVSSEWYLDKDNSKAKEAFISGKAGVYGDYLTKSPNIISDLKQNVPEAEVIRKTVPIDYNNIRGARAENAFGMVSGINANCAHPEAVMMYFEWLNDNLFVIQNGIEGVTYDMDGEIPVVLEGYEGEERLNYNNNKDMWCLVIEGRDLGDEELNIKAQEATYAPNGYEFLIRDEYNAYLEGKQYQYPDYIFSKPIESLTKYGGVLKDKWFIIQTELTNCKPEEFDAKYEELSKDYLASGYQEILDEKKAVYEEEQKHK